MLKHRLIVTVYCHLICLKYQNSQSYGYLDLFFWEASEEISELSYKCLLLNSSRRSHCTSETEREGRTNMNANRRNTASGGRQITNRCY